jgi:hypothetical protein
LIFQILQMTPKGPSLCLTKYTPKLPNQTPSKRKFDAILCIFH